MQSNISARSSAQHALYLYPVFPEPMRYKACAHPIQQSAPATPVIPFTFTMTSLKIGNVISALYRQPGIVDVYYIVDAPPANPIPNIAILRNVTDSSDGPTPVILTADYGYRYSRIAVNRVTSFLYLLWQLN